MQSETLVLERGEQEDLSDESYWSYRVKLSEDQAIIGFVKFGSMIGIGFAREDWSSNTNLPYTSDAEKIYNHISPNKGDAAIAREDCLAAIRLIQDAARADDRKERRAQITAKRKKGVGV
jgi:hypothetical protein